MLSHNDIACIILPTGSKEMQVRLVVRGCETVLGDAASEAELFLTTDLLTRCCPI